MSSSEGISSQNSKNAFVVKFLAAVIGKLILRVKSSQDGGEMFFTSQ